MNMSTDETLGQATKEYSQAKIALAHSEQTLASVAEDYQNAATVLRSYTGKSFVSAEQVIQKLNPFRKNGIDLTLPQIDGDRLMELLRNHEQMVRQVAESHVKLANLGVGNVS